MVGEEVVVATTFVGGVLFRRRLLLVRWESIGPREMNFARASRRQMLPKGSFGDLLVSLSLVVDQK